MKYAPIYIIVLLCVTIMGCQQPEPEQKAPAPKQLIFPDYRPQTEISFLKRVGNEMNFMETKPADATKDQHKMAFDTYVEDSLKNFTDWEFVVRDLDEEPEMASGYAKSFLAADQNPCYNLTLATPIRIDKNIDTIAIENRVEFAYTILKNSTTDELKKQLIRIKTLETGDTVICSGSLIHINDSGKADFSPLFDDARPWTFDALFTNIHIKHH